MIKCRKKRYQTRNQAAAATALVRRPEDKGDPREPYKCTRCLRWHLK